MPKSRSSRRGWTEIIVPPTLAHDYERRAGRRVCGSTSVAFPTPCLTRPPDHLPKKSGFNTSELVRRLNVAGSRAVGFVYYFEPRKGGEERQHQHNHRRRVVQTQRLTEQSCE